MGLFVRRYGGWFLVWLLLTSAGALWIARSELVRLQEDFETNARIAHRLLSQRVVQHDAMMAMLALLQPTSATSRPELRLPSVYPQVVSVLRRDQEGSWPKDAMQPDMLRSAEQASRKNNRAVLAGVDFTLGRYQLVLGGVPASFAIQIDMRSTVPWSEWPMLPQSSPIRVTLQQDNQHFVLQPGTPMNHGWRFDFRKRLASDSQPFDLVASQQVGWQQLPWMWMAAWALAVAALLAALMALQRQRAGRRRAEELLRLGQVACLNAMGELAAGMAHELNQPLTALLANTQAAGRMLRETPPELDPARAAMAQAVEQARRAADVVGRLRRAVERPQLSGQREPVVLQDVVRDVLYLLEPECQRRNVTPTVLPCVVPAVTVHADAVALEQIVHNLLMNALQALELVPASDRRLILSLNLTSGQGVLTVSDSGPGIHPDLLGRIFEPFFSTRERGLGLGLSLCETLAMGMGGTLTASHHAPRGASFHLALPLETAAA